MIRTDYDVWKCARCGTEYTVRALPHNPPVCCGTGTWYQGQIQGKPYSAEVEMSL